MKRLTHRYMDGTAWVSLNLVSKMGEHECVGLPITKLATYEDAEEQGLLIRLPCKVGDTIYIVFHNHTIGESTVVSFKMIAEGWAVKTTDWIYLFTDFGKTVFLTREEAETKLKEMECSHE